MNEHYSGKFVDENFIPAITQLPEIGRAVEFVPRWSNNIVIEGLYGDRGFYEVGKVWGGAFDILCWRYIDEDN